jgi:hypothetical protein
VSRLVLEAPYTWTSEDFTLELKAAGKSVRSKPGAKAPVRVELHLDQLAAGTRIELIASQSKPFVWRATGTVEWNGGGLKIVEAAAEFLNPQWLKGTKQKPGSTILFRMARLRDVTDYVEKVILDAPTARDRHKGLPPQFPPGDKVRLAKKEPIDKDGRIAAEVFDAPRRLPQHVITLEVGGTQAPRLFTVIWPYSVARNKNTKTPFLIYFRPGMSQSKEYYLEKEPWGKYPFGWDYVFYGSWCYSYFWRDPFTDQPELKGLTAHLAASKKKAVVVMPLPSRGPEMGQFQNAGFASAMLKEIQGYLFRDGSDEADGATKEKDQRRKQRKSTNRGALPGFSNIALAGFSSGCDFAVTFFSRPSNATFVDKHLKELHLFDPKPGISKLAYAKVKGWIKRDTTNKFFTYLRVSDAKARGNTGGEDKFKRDHAALTELTGRAPTAKTEILSSAQVTAVVTTNSSWEEATTVPVDGNAKNPIADAWTSEHASKQPADRDGWQIAHQLIPALFLVDALRRGNFEDGG